MIEDLLPAHGKPGGRWNDHQVTLNGIFWWLYSGAQWREVPERYGKWQSLYDRFNFRRADGTLDRILERLHLRLNAGGVPGPRPLERGCHLHSRQSLGGGGAQKKPAPSRA